MNGENQYKAEGFGLQDARKGVLFDSFPPVLQLQLKRFEYDFQRDTMVKVGAVLFNFVSCMCDTVLRCRRKGSVRQGGCMNSSDLLISTDPTALCTCPCMPVHSPGSLLCPAVQWPTGFNTGYRSCLFCRSMTDTYSLMSLTWTGTMASTSVHR